MSDDIAIKEVEGIRIMMRSGECSSPISDFQLFVAFAVWILWCLFVASIFLPTTKSPLSFVGIMFLGPFFGMILFFTVVASRTKKVPVYFIYLDLEYDINVMPHQSVVYGEGSDDEIREKIKKVVWAKEKECREISQQKKRMELLVKDI